MATTKESDLKQQQTPSALADISLIVPRLYLGNYRSATTEAILREHQIKRIFSVLTNHEAIPFTGRIAGMQYKHMTKNDKPGEDMLCQGMLEAIEYLSKANSADENTLVHCQQGISRSATIVTAYLMATNGWTTDRALSFLKSHRPQANPNFGFRNQLRLFERMNYRLDPNLKDFRLYMMNAIVFRNYTDQFHFDLIYYLKRLEELELATKLTRTIVFRCARCKKPLFYDLQVLQAPGINHKDGSLLGQMFSTPKNTTCKYYLVEPTHWMQQTSTGQSLFSQFPQFDNGRIPCPHCNILIGKFMFHPFLTELCSCSEHKGIKSYLALEIHRDSVIKKYLVKKGFFAKLFPYS